MDPLTLGSLLSGSSPLMPLINQVTAAFTGVQQNPGDQEKLDALREANTKLRLQLQSLAARSGALDDSIADGTAERADHVGDINATQDNINRMLADL